ncbi:hypothetical protein BJ993_002671 [Nocardioides aromaticivorans]|uniref:Uncharacterized protein n=1 Tax=Nocardioides aromaticivorans TaxID=200618 RepID=A0A7Y9ZIN9_9ACTN|nr:hypothetical protein [Nocardioides aromaticivorans]NYI45591.1 hypothetical protein [Nocardioides aromaticivorans]
MQRQGRVRRFGAGLLVAFVVSLAVVVVVLVVSTSPDEARSARRPPRLGSPTATVVAESAGDFAVPSLALFDAPSGDRAVRPADGGPDVPVTVVEERDGTVVVSGDGLSDGLRVQLGAYVGLGQDR